MKVADRFDQLLKLLPLDDQEHVRTVWSEIEHASEEEVRERFIRLRQTEEELTSNQYGTA
jgi:hypothetical protein